MRAKWWLAAAAIVLVPAGWTAAWFAGTHWLDGRIDLELARLAAERGITVTCGQRTMAGWPFRVDVICRQAEVAGPDGSRLTAGAVAVAASIDDWHLLRLSALAPLAVDTVDGRQVRASFSTLDASLRFSGRRVERLSVVGETFDVDVIDPVTGVIKATADKGEFHGRPAPDSEGTIDLAASFKGLDVVRNDQPQLPAAADVAGDLSITQVPALLAGPASAQLWSEAGGSAELRTLTVDFGKTRFSASGQTSLNAAGYPVTALSIVGTAPEGLMALSRDNKRPLNPALASFGTAMLLMGAPVDAGRKLDVTIDESGAFKAGRMALGSVRPLF